MLAFKLACLALQVAMILKHDLEVKLHGGAREREHTFFDNSRLFG